jgi:hypothetical protein
MPTTILICGSPADGFQIVGLFADTADAQSYAEDYMLKDWWVAELTSPEAFAESLWKRLSSSPRVHVMTTKRQWTRANPALSKPERSLDDAIASS